MSEENDVVVKVTDCRIKGCRGEFLAKGFCQKHYAQMWRHGKILERTRFDKNKIIKHKNYAEMLLYNKEGQNIVGKTKFDLEDIPKVEKLKWFLFLKKYCISGAYSNYIFLHRLVLNTHTKMEIDHINRDGLDNRKVNLRIVTHQQNMTNHKIRKDCPFGMSGVYQHKGKFIVKITSQNKTFWLGTYGTLSKAIQARKRGEEKYWGEI